MALLTGECGREKRRDDLGGQGDANDPRTDTQHVQVIMLDGLMGRIGVVAHRRPDSWKLVRGDRDAGAASAYDETPVGSALHERRRHRFRTVGVVNRRRRVGPQIVDDVAQCSESGDELAFHLEPGMVGCNGNPHVVYYGS